VLSPYLFNIYLDDVARLNDCYKQTAVIIRPEDATGQKNGVDAFGYNSAESEPIWMKSGAL